MPHLNELEEKITILQDAISQTERKHLAYDKYLYEEHARLQAEINKAYNDGLKAAENHKEPNWSKNEDQVIKLPKKEEPQPKRVVMPDVNF